MTPEDMAATHAASGIAPRAWSAAEFASLLADSAVCATGDTRAFALGRVTLDEGEVLTVATHPDHRRPGLARAAFRALIAAMAASGARRVFLEVAADNTAALGLYTAEGFAPVGRRRGYYAGTDAVVMALDLAESGSLAAGQ